MADEQLIAYNPDAPPGQRFAPEVVAEIEAVAPSAVTNGSLTTQKYKDMSITRPKLALDVVGPDQLDDNSVDTAAIIDAAVTTAKIDNNAVTPEKTDTGVMKMKDSDGNWIEATGQRMTAAQYAAVVTPDPNTFYFVSA